MKKVIICLGVIFSFIACQTGNVEEDIVTKNRMNSALDDEDSLPSIIDYLDDTESLYWLSMEYVNRNREIFGSEVMVFRSYEQLEETLDAFEEMDMNSLREWTIETGWTSDIIEANILYDSILLEQYQAFGIEFDDDCDGDSNLLAATISAFDIAYAMRPDYFHMRYDEDGEEVWDLVGTLDEYALYNEKRLFVVEGRVHKLCTDGGVLICPVDLYSEYQVEGPTHIAYMTYCEQTSENQLPYVGIARPNYFREISRKTEDGRYQTDVYFRVDEYTFLFFVDHYAYVKVRNYYYNQRQRKYVAHRCRTQLDLTIYSGFGNRNFVFEFHKNKKYKSASWRKHKLAWDYWDNEIQSYDLNLETSNGLVIDMSE